MFFMFSKNTVAATFADVIKRRCRPRGGRRQDVEAVGLVIGLRWFVPEL